MIDLLVHEKRLPVPSFFQVYNFGGGVGDKSREIVYAELTNNTPALINYYYINNEYPHGFSSKYFDNIDSYEKIGDLFNDIRYKLINDKKNIYSGYATTSFDFNSKVFLLDSGAYNIVKIIAESINYDITKFKSSLIEHLKKYYDFADRIKVDIVVGFDLGGKYTHKDNEKTNDKLNNFLSLIDAEEINNILLEETTKYLSQKKEYYPYVLATVHGATPQLYSDSVDIILNLEKKYKYQFWGFALGGIASYRQVDQIWYEDIDFNITKKRGYIETVTPARACTIVKNKVENRPIHALGCGGYPNIALNYFCGATSFDAASPVRRVGDGNEESTNYVFEINPIKNKNVSFSKYFVGGINSDNTLRSEPAAYKNLNEIKDEIKLCGCLACNAAGSIFNIKKLYSMKSTDTEANYFSRQLMGLHAVNQHKKLCEVISSFNDLKEFTKMYPSNQNLKLLEIYKQI